MRGRARARARSLRHRSPLRAGARPAIHLQVVDEADSRALNQRYREFFKEPKVVVNVDNVSSKWYFVQGETGAGRFAPGRLWTCGRCAWRRTGCDRGQRAAARPALPTAAAFAHMPTAFDD